MRKYIFVIICSLALMDCQESKDLSIANSKSLFKKEVGEQIPLDVAARWVARFRNTHAGREATNPTLSAEVLNALLNPLDDKLGVVLQHATDEDGLHHILIIPYKSNTSLWNTTVLDANSGEMIENETGESWAAVYKSENPSGPWSHFFGINIFESILGNSHFSSLEIVPGLNESYTNLLVLYAFNVNSNESGRTEGDGVQAYDASILCPTACAP
jgi:hypothetical protein